MKKLFCVARDKNKGFAILKVALSLAVVTALAWGLWLASTPLAQAAPKTPAEVIQAQLPKDMTIANASDPQLLQAVCKSVKQSPADAALFVRTAGGARQSLRGDLLCMSVHCLGDLHASDKGAPDCTWVLDIVREWIKQDPNIANQLVESVSNCAPDCRDALQNLGVGEGAFGNVPANINPPPGSAGGGASGDVCIVCHNGSNVQVACSILQSYLAGHPGDTSGACQATPVANK